MKNYMSAKVKMNKVQNYRLFVDLNLALMLIETVVIYLLVEDLGLLWLGIMALAYMPILLAVLGPKENEVEATKTYEFHLIVEFVILFINTFTLCIYFWMLWPLLLLTVLCVTEIELIRRCKLKD